MAVDGWSGAETPEDSCAETVRPDLLERLRAWEEYGEYSILMESRQERPRNPDGKEAAAAIERLSRENDALRAEVERLKAKERPWDEKLKQMHDHQKARAEAAEAALAMAREALEIIAGKRQCLDNLMGNRDVAEADLAALPPAPTE